MLACTPTRLFPTTPPPAPKKSMSQVFIANQADDDEGHEVETLYQRMSKAQISSSLPSTPLPKTSSPGGPR
ncbi:hypothetical protein HDZ31DRAFT_69336 [Schizophyllum fasciatum]